MSAGIIIAEQEARQLIVVHGRGSDLEIDDVNIILYLFMYVFIAIPKVTFINEYAF